MRKSADQHTQAVTQLRMGLLGTVTAIILCFAAAFTFSGLPSQAAVAEAVPSTE